LLGYPIIRDKCGRVVCRPDDKPKEEVAGNSPRDKEDTECAVAKRAEGDVAEHLGKLKDDQLEKCPVKTRKMAYRKPDVAPVHEHHDHASDSGKVVEVAADHEGDGDDMVDHHLPVVLAASLSVEE
jgi:hypothetical protein